MALHGICLVSVVCLSFEICPLPGEGGGHSVKCWVRECHRDTETDQRDVPIQLILLEYEPWALKCFAFASLDQ